MLKVKILEHTPNPENVVANAARLCYSSLDIEGLFNKYTNEENKKMIDKLVAMGHESPLEHISFTFGIEGVSRALTHQLVRHRIGSSYSQKSQRYVMEGQFEYVIPPVIAEDEKLKKIYVKQMNQTQDNYDYMVDQLIKQGKTEKQAIEDARYILPNACETKIIVTMNARALLNFFNKRTCNRAQWEIREMADEMLNQVRTIAPNLFKFSGAGCVYGKCPEGTMSCKNPRVDLRII